MKKLQERKLETIPGENFGTPKEVWGFRTGPEAGSTRSIARRFLRANAELFGLEPDLAGLEFRRRVRSLGADHLIFQQVYAERRVHRAYVTVHVNRRGQVYLAKNRAVPLARLPTAADFRLSQREAVRQARKRLARSTRRATLQDIEEMWFWRRGRLVPALRVRLGRRAPREEWIVHIDARSGGLLCRHDNLAHAAGRGRIFDPSPVTALGGHSGLITPRGNPRRPPPQAYRTVRLAGLANNGRLEGRYVTTRPTRSDRRVRRRSRSFLFDSSERGFEEVMVYHHIDRAIRYLRSLGFRGARSIFDAPVRVDVNGTPQDNSWYSPWDELLTFGTGAIDDAEDGETILHEFAHAVQDAIVPDFGQSEEAAAMGEGFADYFAASRTADRKPARYRPCVMTWDGLLLGLAERLDPPCLRRVDADWTCDDFVAGDDEHENGTIWSATLWDVREALGARIADTLIVESHFQLDGFTTFARGARAILDADANLYAGAHRSQLRPIFRRRAIAPI